MPAGSRAPIHQVCSRPAAAHSQGGRSSDVRARLRALTCKSRRCQTSSAADVQPQLQLHQLHQHQQHQQLQHLQPLPARYILHIRIPAVDSLRVRTVDLLSALRLTPLYVHVGHHAGAAGDPGPPLRRAAQGMCSCCSLISLSKSLLLSAELLLLKACLARPTVCKYFETWGFTVSVCGLLRSCTLCPSLALLADMCLC